MQLMSERVFFMVLLTMFLERCAFTACVHMLYALNLSPFLHHQIDVSFLDSNSPLICLNRKTKGKYKKICILTWHLPILFCSELTGSYFILMPVQVLYWAKEEYKMEKLKARLIELYYENLFKVSSLFCANSVS